MLHGGQMGGKTKGLFLSSKTIHQKGEMKFPVSTKGKTESQTCNRDIKYFHRLGVRHIASQCLNKKTINTRVDGDVEIESEGDDDQMPSLKDACDDDVEYLVEGESLVTRCALNAQVKEDDME